MSVEHLAVCLHHSRASGTAKLVLLGIANHCGDGGAWPAIETLARYANVHERNVQRALEKLVSLGELVVHDPSKERRTNLYELRVSCPGHCDRTPQHRDTRRTTRQTSLWITRGGANATPGTGATPVGGAGATPPPAGAPPEPSLNTSTEPRPEVVAQPQDTRPCQECGQAEAKCQAPQVHWDAEDRHPYQPRKEHAHA